MSGPKFEHNFCLTPWLIRRMNEMFMLTTCAACQVRLLLTSLRALHWPTWIYWLVWWVVTFLPLTCTNTEVTSVVGNVPLACKDWFQIKGVLKAEETKKQFWGTSHKILTVLSFWFIEMIIQFTLERKSEVRVFVELQVVSNVRYKAAAVLRL